MNLQDAVPDAKLIWLLEEAQLVEFLSLQRDFWIIVSGENFLHRKNDAPAAGDAQ
jgi:hypothetical protein